MTPHVGIVYLVDGKLWIDSAPVAEASNFGDLAFHKLQHEQYWKQLVEQGVAPDTEYTEFPRGRVSYERQSHKFTLLADECILRRKTLVSAILQRMNLPVGHTKIGADGGYRCSECLRRDNLGEIRRHSESGKTSRKSEQGQRSGEASANAKIP